jgi:hypothetical protein
MRFPEGQLFAPCLCVARFFVCGASTGAWKAPRWNSHGLSSAGALLHSTVGA